MSEIQPWHHNRKPTPEQATQLKRANERLLRAFLRAWWPAILWAGVIFFLSTDTFSSEHTATVLAKVLYGLIPNLTAGGFDVIHHFIRKSAHFTEYFIFYLFLYRGVRGARSGWRWTWGLAAWSAAAAYSALDEIHQAFVASRTASVYDSLLDSVGALVALLVLYLYFRPPLPPARNHQ